MDDLLNTAPCGFLTFTDDGAIALANATLHDMLGYEQGKLSGRSIDALLSVSGRMFYQTYFFPLLKMHGKAEEIYLSLRNKQGEVVPVLSNARRTEREGIVVYDCVFLPMHHRNQYEDEILQAKKTAEAASRSKANFLSMMSHELRNPLHVIRGFADILALDLQRPGMESQQSDLAHIKRASDSLLRLIGDILNFARMESGQLDIRLENVSIETALDHAEPLVLHRLEEAGLTYSRDECPPELEAQADRDRLQQILLNLLTNAIKFTPSGGSIRIQSELVGERVLIHVRDTGCGIPDDKIGQIFDPFVQVDRDRVESSQRGVGLGLAISRDLARAMGGDLTVQSTIGEGSVFTLALLPARPASSSPLASGSRPESSSSTE
jgi:PAS domain S-box-containing protein